MIRHHTGIFGKFILPVVGAVSGTFVGNAIDGQRLDVAGAVTGSVWNLIWGNLITKWLKPCK